jgi:hypothetical protein
MTQLARKAKDAIFDLALQINFRDPFTGEGPTTEEALSSLLVVFHQRSGIRWNEVPLHKVKDEVEKAADYLFPSRGIICAEYPFFYADETEMNIWGGMRADVLYFNKDPHRVVLIENKIGSGFTYGPKPDEGQLGRQLRYLMRTGLNPSFLILLTLKDLFHAGWYFNELRQALEYDNAVGKVGAFVMLWEDVIKATSG